MTISQADVDALFAETSSVEASVPIEQAPNTAAGQPAPVQQSGPRTPRIERILNISVPVAVLLAERDMPIETILETTVGTIYEFVVPFDSELNLQVANHTIGAGQAVKVGENFGLRISRIGSVEERIDAMGGK